MPCSWCLSDRFVRAPLARWRTILKPRESPPPRLASFASIPRKFVLHGRSGFHLSSDVPWEFPKIGLSSVAYSLRR